LSIAVSVSAWNVVSRLREPLVSLGFAIFWYAFILLVPMSYIAFINYQDYVMNAYLWLLLAYFSGCQALRNSGGLGRHANLAPEPGQV